MTSEAEIVWALKEELALNAPRLHPWRITDIGVDSDASYRNSPCAAQLEPMASMPIRGFYPDLVCNYASPAESGIAAFEVKASFDYWVKGITQARAYREGVHRSFLAVPEGSGSRYSVLERDARESGVGVWLLRKSGWEEVVPSAPPRPSLTEAKNLAAALQGVVLPKRLQLNHPLNYLAVVWAATNQETGRVMEAMEDHWPGLRSPGSRQHALNGARYLGLLSNADTLTRLGLFLANPRDLERPNLPSSAFSPSFVFQFKQTLWHAGILSTPIHKTAGKGADTYEHQQDYWKLENHFAQSI